MSKLMSPNISIHKQHLSEVDTTKAFVKTVKDYYKKHGRHNLPWRLTNDAYQILVSEIMLQQTQVERVVPKYEQFIEKWPQVAALADASLAEVLTAWQGLGYNSRAKRLRHCAQVVVNEHRGIFPADFQKLKDLPGIGPYTAGAIMTFAFNTAVPLIETNVRTVYLHHFFKDATDVSDEALLEFVRKTLDHKNPRAWYSALMDYGTHLKKMHGNPNSRSAVYSKQSTFAGSNRQIRGQLIKCATEAPFSRKKVHTLLKQFDVVRIDAQIEQLRAEGLLQLKQGKYCLSD